MSLVVAAPPGSYGTGTPQQPITISSVALVSNGLGAAPVGELVAPTTSGRSIRLWALMLQAQNGQSGNPRTSETITGMLVAWVSTDKVADGASTYTVPQGLITVASVSMTVSFVANFPGGEYGNVGVKGMVRNYRSGLILPPNKGLYVTLPPVIGQGSGEVWVTAFYDLP